MFVRWPDKLAETWGTLNVVVKKADQAYISRGVGSIEDSPTRHLVGEDVWLTACQNANSRP